ncbi:MAG: sulfotransferase family 2 domain-containing protein [Anaerolineae bacterium]|nr:sulfotransferase family 2 domain-containing protein [Anaerolineae bacterium]
MLISHSKRFIFIHIVRTGGTSIKHALAIYDSTSVEHPPVTPADHINIRSNQFRKHATAVEVKAKLPNEIFKNYFKFTFVRNPWDLMASQYHYLLQKKDHRLHTLVSRMDSFEEYIDWRAHQSDRKFLQQKDYCFDSDGKLLMNFMGRYETLENDFMTICDLIKVGPIRLPRLNASEHGSYRNYYNQRTRHMIYDLYRQDIELLQYEF